ncbi:uncharacterized protein ARMOST_07707 [Armillaria ostoyae]|uniref:Chromo domain-containing protein n=1 Tax=Armillaria ostoyae TaxID=47428 RepID=A0A284R6I6_ARMOS|nr:uncharacterized protein ARMOST_07707 [Armillaria ostoyae]
MPQVVISDRGPQFISAFMKELYQMLDIKQNASTAFHPQTDGQTEHVNQEVEKYLHIFINFRQDDWADWLLLAEFAHNNCAHSATGKSPFMILYGRNPRIMPDSLRSANSKVPTASDFSKAMAKIHKETEEALKEAAGPFKILKKTGASAYKLKLLLHWKIHPRFNEKLLTLYTPPAFPNQEQPPPPLPDLIDEEEQWEVEEVLDSKPRKVRSSRGQPSTTVIDYFIKWKGWTWEHNSWVTAKDMGNAKEAIANYEKKTQHNERVAVVKIATTPQKSPRYDHGTQKWIRNPSVDKYKVFLEEYWANYYSAQDNLQEVNA